MSELSKNAACECLHETSDLICYEWFITMQHLTNKISAMQVDLPCLWLPCQSHNRCCCESPKFAPLTWRGISRCLNYKFLRIGSLEANSVVWATHGTEMKLNWRLLGLAGQRFESRKLEFKCAKRLGKGQQPTNDDYDVLWGLSCGATVSTLVPVNKR